MALSNAEKQRRFRERKQAAKSAGLKRPEGAETAALFQAPFFESFQSDGNTSDFEQCFDLIGLDAPEFNDDSGPQSREGILDHPDNDESVYGNASDSLGRAEIMVGGLLESAVTLAGIIRQHKLGELQLREKEVAEAMVARPEDAPILADELLRIRAAQSALDKEVRWPIPAWKVDPAG